jgi:branched-chain amino acid transport system substrate-binding protein
MRKLYVVMAMILLLMGCESSKIKVGFIGSLSIKQSQLSIDARNAIELYFEEVNEDGGIRGKKLELVVKDDEADHDTALAMHDEFVEEGVEFIIGHMTSNMANSMMESSDKPILFITPSVSSTLIDAIDDNIIRTSPILDGQALKYLESITKFGFDNNLIIYDLMNADYAKTLSDRIIDFNGSSINIDQLEFDSREDDTYDIIDSIDISIYDSVIFITQAIDTATFAQYVRTLDEDIFMMSVSWSMTEDLIIHGGRNVEGMYILGVKLPDGSTKLYKDFTDRFLEKFGYEPSFVSLLAYDSAMVLVEGLRKTIEISPEAVKATILDIETFDGIIEEISFNNFGDADRGYSNYEVVNGEFVPVD